MKKYLTALGIFFVTASVLFAVDIYVTLCAGTIELHYDVELVDVMVWVEIGEPWCAGPEITVSVQYYDEYDEKIGNLEVKHNMAPNQLEDFEWNFNAEYCIITAEGFCEGVFKIPDTGSYICCTRHHKVTSEKIYYDP